MSSSTRRGTHTELCPAARCTTSSKDGVGGGSRHTGVAHTHGPQPRDSGPSRQGAKVHVATTAAMARAGPTAGRTTSCHSINNIDHTPGPPRDKQQQPSGRRRTPASSRKSRSGRRAPTAVPERAAGAPRDDQFPRLRGRRAGRPRGRASRASPRAAARRSGCPVPDRRAAGTRSRPFIELPQGPAPLGPPCLDITQAACRRRRRSSRPCTCPR